MKIEGFRRNTRQRRIILEELQGCSSHPTASELYEKVRRRLPKISLGTIYRTLDLLSRNGVIQKLENPEGETRFDGNTAPHDHIRCIRCGALIDFHGPRIDIGKTNEASRGYLILGYRLEFLALCPHCRTTADETQSPQSSLGKEEEKWPRKNSRSTSARSAETSSK